MFPKFWTAGVREINKHVDRRTKICLFIQESGTGPVELMRIKTYLSAKEKINEKLFVACFDDVFIGYVNQEK